MGVDSNYLCHGYHPNMRKISHAKVSLDFSKVTFLSFFILFSLWAGRSEALDVWVTNPWLSMLTRFIGGVQVTVHPVVTWGEKGQPVKARTVPPPGAIVFSVVRGEGVRLLGKGFEEKYSNFSLLEKPPFVFDFEESFLDPATLPFIGLRTLQILSACDSGEYEYFQRRLAEFQARLDSTVIVGRNMIGDSPILDLCWKYGRWLQAVSGETVKPPAEVKERWSRSQALDILDTALGEARKQGWVIVIDPWTPEAVREKIEGSTRVIELSIPRIEDDIILFLYDHCLRIWDHLRRNS